LLSVSIVLLLIIIVDNGLLFRLQCSANFVTHAVAMQSAYLVTFVTFNLTYRSFTQP